MRGFSFTQNNIEYVIVLPSITYTSRNKVVAGSQELEIYDSTVMASLETAIAAYQPGGASGTSFTKDDFVTPRGISGFYMYKSPDGTTFYTNRNTSTNLNKSYIYNSAEDRWPSKSYTSIPDPFYGYNVWYADGKTFYSSGTTHRVLNYNPSTGTATWNSKSWSGLSNFTGTYVWSAGSNVYYSNGTAQYVLDVSTSTWSVQTWVGLTEFDGRYVWSDGSNVYYSNGAAQYVLDVSTSTWSEKVWNGFSSIYGRQVWSDGSYIYLSNTSDQYVLDVSSSTWSEKVWNGLSSFTGVNIYNINGIIYWGDNNGVVKKLDTTTSTWLDWYAVADVDLNASNIISGNTVYNLNDIDMSFKPKSNNP